MLIEEHEPDSESGQNVVKDKRNTANGDAEGRKTIYSRIAEEARLLRRLLAKTGLSQIIFHFRAWMTLSTIVEFMMIDNLYGITLMTPSRDATTQIVFPETWDHPDDSCFEKWRVIAREELDTIELYKACLMVGREKEPEHVFCIKSGWMFCYQRNYVCLLRLVLCGY